MDYSQMSFFGTAVGFAYRVATIVLVAAAFIFIRSSRAGSTRPWSALAVAACVLGILHPTIWVVILTAVKIPCYELPWYGRGDDEMLSFGYSVIVLSLAIVAVVRIARSKKQLRGVPFCIVAFFTGGFVFLNWIVLLLIYVTAYRFS